MIQDFKAFVMRGNVVDLAVGVVIGLAFQAVVDALVEYLLTPLVTIPGKVNFGDLAFTIRESRFGYGAFLNELISFVIVAAAVFFLVVRPLNRLMALRKPGDLAPTTRECPECLSEVPIRARRCAHCTSELTTA